MVSALKSRLAGYVTNPNPAQIVTLFLCGLGLLMLASMGIGWLSDTLGDSICAMCSALATWLCTKVPEFIEDSARHFPFFSGALAVTWATYIARRVHKARKNDPTRWDLLFFVVGLWVFVCYYANAGTVLSDSQGFIYFLGIYSTAAVWAFCTMTVFLSFEAICSDDAGISVIFIFVAVLSAVATGAIANDIGRDSTGMSILLGIVHFVASCVGIGIAFWFCDVVDDMPE